MRHRYDNRERPRPGWPVGYLDFESKILNELEKEWRENYHEGLRSLIITNRIVLEAYWRENKWYR